MIRSLLRGMLLLAVMKIASADAGLLNVSYDVTREFYKEFNCAFAAYWKKKTGETVNVNQSQAVHFKDGGLFDQIYQVK